MGGVVLVVTGGLCIAATGGAATPIVVAGWGIGGGTIAFGVADSVEGAQDIYYGSMGDIDSISINQLKDVIFQGNEDAYYMAENIFAFAASVFIPISQASVAGNLTFRSGSTIVAKEGISMAAGEQASAATMNVTGNQTASMLAGMLAGGVTAQGLNGIDGKFNISGWNNGGGNSLIDIDAIRSQLKTEPDTAFFWSGRTDGIGGAEVAADIAKGRGGVTLETTIEAKNISMPEWDFNNPSTMEAWDLASGAYAEQVSGEIRAVIGSELRIGNIWENVELPRLKDNPNVTKITTIDPKTGIETIIFER